MPLDDTSMGIHLLGALSYLQMIEELHSMWPQTWKLLHFSGGAQLQKCQWWLMLLGRKGG
jgi:hypothetical protein